jgi:hypothetical protein
MCLFHSITNPSTSLSIHSFVESFSLAPYCRRRLIFISHSNHQPHLLCSVSQSRLLPLDPTFNHYRRHETTYLRRVITAIPFLPPLIHRFSSSTLCVLCIPFCFTLIVLWISQIFLSHEPLSWTCINCITAMIPWLMLDLKTKYPTK